MAISEDAKEYIANHFGAGTPKCFVSSGISYTDPNGNAQTGSTKDVVSTLKLNAGGTAYGPNREKFYDIDDFHTIDDDAIIWIGNSQSGSSQYCITAGKICTAGTKRCNTARTAVEQCDADGMGWSVVQTCGSEYYCDGGVCVPGTAPERPETGPLQVTILEGEQCPPGSPSVNLDTTEAFAYFKADPCMYVGVMEILVQSLSNKCFTYYTWEMRMWDGEAGTTCPVTEPEWKQISRFLGEVNQTKPISIKMLGASENKMIGGSFEIPSDFRGVKTICLSLWGDYDKQTLLDDLAAVGYDEEIAWADIK